MPTYRRPQWLQLAHVFDLENGDEFHLLQGVKIELIAATAHNDSSFGLVDVHGADGDALGSPQLAQALLAAPDEERVVAKAGDEVLVVNVVDAVQLGLGADAELADPFKRCHAPYLGQILAHCDQGSARFP